MCKILYISIWCSCLPTKIHKINGATFGVCMIFLNLPRVPNLFTVHAFCVTTTSRHFVYFFFLTLPTVAFFLLRVYIFLFFRPMYAFPNSVQYILKRSKNYVSVTPINVGCDKRTQQKLRPKSLLFIYCNLYSILLNLQVNNCFRPSRKNTCRN